MQLSEDIKKKFNKFNVKSIFQIALKLIKVGDMQAGKRFSCFQWSSDKGTFSLQTGLSNPNCAASSPGHADVIKGMQKTGVFQNACQEIEHSMKGLCEQSVFP